MSMNLSEYRNLLECEQTSGIRADTLRKACRTGKLPAKRVGGRTGPWLVLKNDIDLFSEEYFKKGEHQVKKELSRPKNSIKFPEYQAKRPKNSIDLGPI